MEMTLIKPSTVYRTIELVFDSNLESTLTHMAEEVVKTFTKNKFMHATLVIEIINPSKEKMFS